MIIIENLSQRVAEKFKKRFLYVENQLERTVLRNKCISRVKRAGGEDTVYDV